MIGKDTKTVKDYGKDTETVSRNPGKSYPEKKRVRKDTDAAFSGDKKDRTMRDFFR